MANTQDLNNQINLILAREDELTKAEAAREAAETERRAAYKVLKAVEAEHGDDSAEANAARMNWIHLMGAEVDADKAVKAARTAAKDSFLDYLGMLNPPTK